MGRPRLDRSDSLGKRGIQVTLDEDRIAGDGLFYCVPWMKVAHARIRELETRLSESEQHRTKNRDTAVALQDEVTDLRMKLGFRDEENVHALTAALRGASRTDAEASAQEREPK